MRILLAATLSACVFGNSRLSQIGPTASPLHHSEQELPPGKTLWMMLAKPASPWVRNQEALCMLEIQYAHIQAAR